MGFDLAKLARLVSDNGLSYWHYDTDDDACQLASPGYFGEVRGLLRRGELIFASCLDAGLRTTAPFLVTSQPDETSQVEPLFGARGGTGGAPESHPTSLGALTDVRIDAAERNQVLTYDGQTWVNGRIGSLGDAHAAAAGNPHQTSAAEIGAIAVDEKAQPNGVATLDASGRVPSAQMPALFGGPISTSAMFYAADPRLAGGLKSGNPAAANDEALTSLFAAVRESTADRKHVEFPAGTFDISASIAPSGRMLGRGDGVGSMTTFEFRNCEFVVNGDAADYNEMTLDNADAWLTFDRFSLPLAGARTYRPGSDLFDTAGRALRKYIVFDIRNCGGLCCLGRLSITRRGSRLPHLVAFGSSGGDRSTHGCSGMQGGSVAHLSVENFAIGMLAMQLTSSGDRMAGTWSFVDFGTWSSRPAAEAWS